MSKCQTCGADVIFFEHTKEKAIPWIRLLVFKVRNETDDAVYQFDFCSPQCLSKFAKFIAGETQPIENESKPLLTSTQLHGGVLNG